MAINLAETGDLEFEKGLPGMDVDINISSIVSYVNGDQYLEPGVAVGIDDERHLGPPSAGNVVGIVVRHPVYIANEDGQWRYRPSDAVPVMEFGRVWAICTQGSVGNGREQVTCEADGTLGVGGAIPIVGAFWDSRSEAGGIAIARLNRVLLPDAAAPSSSEPAASTPEQSASTDTNTNT